jgi:hypothetical protein
VDCLIKASEDWSETYTKDMENHARLIRTEASYERGLRRLFRDTARTVEANVNWGKYNALVTADLDVETIITGSIFDEIDDNFMTLSFDFIATATAIGAQSGEKLYKIPVGLQSTDEIIQKLTTERVAWLVGKRVDKDGMVVDNPNAEYRISDKTRRDLNQSIKTSLSLGEDKAQAVARLQSVINNPKRATDIAQTEMVNAHGSGLIEYGRQSGATGKRSRDVNAKDDCATFSRQGIVPLEHLYGGKHISPAYHTRCRCGLVLDYAK